MLSKFQRQTHRDTGCSTEDDPEQWKEKYLKISEEYNKLKDDWNNQVGELVDGTKTMRTHLESENASARAMHEEELSKIQQAVFLQVEEAHWTKTDDDLQKEITGLRNEITLWAKRWARKSLEELPAEDLERLRHNLVQTVLLDPNGLVLEKSIQQGKVLSLLLGALLSHALHHDIIRNPFFFVRRCEMSSVDPAADYDLFLDSGYLDMCRYMNAG
jgi:hypothetical protein